MWDFSHIFPTREAFEAAFAECVGAVENIDRFRGHLGDSPTALAEGLGAVYGAAERREKVYSYASLHKEADNSDP